MRWNTPLSEDHAARLLNRLEVGRRHSVLDLGCGWGELLLRAVGDLATGIGIDAGLLELGCAAAAAGAVADASGPAAVRRRRVGAPVPARDLDELDEWDEFEDLWRAGREEWRLAPAGDPRATAVAAELAERQTEYLDVYRGVLGFTYLVLTRE